MIYARCMICASPDHTVEDCDLSRVPRRDSARYVRPFLPGWGAEEEATRRRELDVERASVAEQRADERRYE